MDNETDRNVASSPEEEVSRIIEAAERLGVEVDQEDAAQWLTAMAGTKAGTEEVVVDSGAGIYGHRVTLLDFDPEVLDRYRRLASIVEIPDQPGVQTAIALSGSAAQSRIQLFPGDADFFERVNIQAPTRAEACQVLADVLRAKSLDKFKGDTYELVEVKWGTFQQDLILGGDLVKAGMPISWSARDVKDGRFEALTPEGEAMTIHWDYGTLDPGWCKLDWVVVEADRGRVVHVSNMLDATWETPAGEIVPLDGYLDPYFQEVYLDAESIPLFTKLVRHVSPDALRDYVTQLESEVKKYSRRDPKNYGKVAKRLYNIFRLTGRWPEAAFVRELFDEPAALLYQVGSLLDTIDEAVSNEVSFDRDVLIDQVDRLILSVVRVAEGPVEEQLVDALLKLRDDMAGRRLLGGDRGGLLAKSYHQVGDLVNDYFRERLSLFPTIDDYLDSLPD